MNRKICVHLDFPNDAQKEQIRAAAEAAGFEVGFFTTAETDAAKAYVQNCEVLYAMSPAVLKEAPAGLKWFCAASAGVDVYCSHPELFKNPDCVLTNSNVYGVTIAEYTVMVLLMLLRQMPYYREPLLRHEWPGPVPVRSIRDAQITILGTGNLGENIALRMKGMNAGRVIGVSRSGRAKNADAFDALYPTSELDRLLPEAEILILALPATPDTVNILNAERIARLRSDAIVINVGRGNALDQAALAEALNTDRIAGAALDVTVPEPLPADDPLWNAKNLIITPHFSGNTSLGYTCEANVESFCEDLKNYMAGKPLAHQVDRTRGY